MFEDSIMTELFSNFSVSEPQYLHSFILIKEGVFDYAILYIMFIEIIKVGASELIMSTPILSRWCQLIASHQHLHNVFLAFAWVLK